MTDKLSAIGDGSLHRKRTYDPNLAEELNREAELEEKRNKRKPKVEPEREVVLPTGEAFEPENYLLLGGRKHGNYEYENMFVMMSRLPLNAEAERALRELNIYESLQKRAGVDENKQQNPLNPQKENSGNNYLGYANWEEAMNLVHQFGGAALTLRQGLDLKKDLESAIDGDKKLYDGKGQLIQASRAKLMHDEMFAVRSPWRSEWLNAKFEKQGDEWLIHYYIRDDSGKIIKRTENIGQHLRKDCRVELATANDYGIPTKEGSDIFYWFPRDKSVAWFSADSGGAYLGCSGDPSYSGASLGVRLVRAQKNSGGNSELY